MLISKPNVRKFSAVQRTFTRNSDTDTSVSVDLGSLTWTDKRGDVANPNWRDEVKRHVGATTPCSGEVYKFEGHTSGLVETTLKRILPGVPYEKVTRRHVGDLLSANDLSPFSFYSNPTMKSRVGNVAVAGFLNKCADARRQLEGGVFVGEIKEALHQVTHPGKAFRKLLNEYVRDARRRTRSLKRTGNRIDPSRISDANKIVSDTWLEWSFGAKPLLSDVKSGAEALAELLTRTFDVKDVRYVAQEEEDTTPSSKAAYTGAFNLFTIYAFHQQEIAKVLCRIVGQVKIEVTNPITMAREVLGFAPGDFVPTVYNLIPYSFLLDYFTNMGDVIQAWSFPSEKLAWFNRTYRVTRTRKVNGQFLKVFNNDSHYTTDFTIAPPIKVTLSSTRFDRDSTNLGLPTLVFQIPGFSTKWLNIAGLAHMRFL